MPRNTSVTLGEHFSKFIDSKTKEGCFESTSEAVRAGLRLLEDNEAQLLQLWAAILVGIDSGISERSPQEIVEAARKRLRTDGRI